jgi:hypothetical protein
MFLSIMPMVFSLLPAATRACVRVKVFLPQSLAPGWGLVASAPLFVVLTLALFIFFYHARGNLLLILGLLLWIGAPLIYLTKFSLLTRPLTERRDLDALAKVQTAVVGAIAGGVLLIIFFLFDAGIVGTSGDALRPWSATLHATWIEFVGRSQYMTVLFADALMLISLSVWREEKKFAGTEGAGLYDRTMDSLETVVERRA